MEIIAQKPFIGSNRRFGVEAIGVVHSCYVEKFGIPRQSGLVKSAQAEVELLPPCNREEMVKGLREFSHIWILFLFHQAVAERWKATVRPPRLGGRTRVGVFASRSPHRPNHLGMSAVRLEGISTVNGSVRLAISGADLLDGTPVVDIKPYIPYSDGIGEAGNGYAAKEFPLLAVRFSPAAERFCHEYFQVTGRNLRQLIEETLACDPRPASQKAAEKEFGMLFWDINVRWRVEEQGIEVLDCFLVQER